MSSQFLGGSTQLVLDLNGVPITAALSGEQLRKPNEKVSIAIDPRHVLLLADEAQASA